MPGTFLQLHGHQRMELVDGRVVTVLPVHANASGKALTVEVRPRRSGRSADGARVPAPRPCGSASAGWLARIALPRMT